MTIADLARMTEGMLLRVVEILLQPKFPAIKPNEIITSITGLKRTLVDQCKVDKGCIGGRAWKKLEAQLSQPLYHLWMVHNDLHQPHPCPCRNSPHSAVLAFSLPDRT
jgi:hypothetical protein